jgi:hypothetical protein
LNTYKVNTASHSDFLNEKRQDPITGDLILEGDEIVFCQECKSAFLKSSWEYLDKNHCNQSQTLQLFPKSLILSFFGKKNRPEYFFSISKNGNYKSITNKLKGSDWQIKEYNLPYLPKIPSNLSAYGAGVGLLFSVPFLFLTVVFSSSFINEWYILSVSFTVIFALLLPIIGYFVFPKNLSVTTLGVSPNGFSIHFPKVNTNYEIHFRQVEKIIIRAKNKKCLYIKIITRSKKEINFELYIDELLKIVSIMRLVSNSNQNIEVVLENFGKFDTNYLEKNMIDFPNNYRLIENDEEIIRINKSKKNE